MAICEFFLRGTCRFGDRCRNEHPSDPKAFQGGGFGNSSWNRNTSAGPSNPIRSFLFTADSIRDDLTPNKDKPLWPLSSYGPAKHEPLVISGLDQSPEELRVKAAEAMKANNAQEYMTYESNQISAAENVFMNARTNFNQVFEKAKQQSPLPEGSSTPASGFGAFASSGTSAFAATPGTSAFGAPAAATSAFGTPSQPATSAFGTPANTGSAFGNLTSTATSAFGTPAFGAPANTTTPAANASAFGKPSFGQSAFGQTAFGQTSTPAAPSTTTTSAFGQPAFGQSAFGAAAQPAGGSSLIKPATGFGAYANAAPSAFSAGASSTPAPGNTTSGGGAFSAFSGAQPSAFAAATANKPATGSVFGQSSFGSTSALTNAFGGGVFGTPAQQPPATSAFGTPASTSTTTAPAQGSFSSFANPQGSVSAFDTPQGATSAFGQPAQPNSAFSGSAFSQPQPATSAFGGSAFQTGPPTTQPQGNPLSSLFGGTSGGFNANPAPSQGVGGILDFGQAKYNYRMGIVPADAKLPPNYSQLMPEAVVAAFKALKFEWGKVPEWIPPVELRVKEPKSVMFS